MKKTWPGRSAAAMRLAAVPFSAMLLAAILFAVMTIPAMPAAAEDGGPTEIRTAEDLRLLAERPGGWFLLTRDIDLGGADWTPAAFSGTLDGCGHTLYNLRVTGAGPERRTAYDGNKKPYETAFAGLFSVLEGATVRNLRLMGARVDVTAEEHCFAAVLAGYADRVTLENVTVDGRVRLVNRGVMSGVGGLAGYGCGRFAGCEARVELVFEDENFGAKCEQFLGGVLACGIGSIEDCTVAVDGWVSCHGYCHNGGLMGMYFHCNTGHPRGPVNGNTITVRITFFEDNRDRRAYCRGGIGEHLDKPTQTRRNDDRGFRKKEVRRYDRVLRPEACETPAYTETRIPADGDTWACTEHRCTGCGYTWRDTYVPGP